MDYPMLPISGLKPAFCEALAKGSLLLEAEPGAGKSTLAPLWALEATPGEVWLVQPRVLAALNLAKRLAELLGEAPGQSVGYQVPFERCYGRQTRLLLMTPGVLLQRLLADPELSAVSCVLLDEIHERSVDQDTAWALLQEAAVLNERLSLVLMSATPDAALKRQVDTALFSPGRCFPVALHYCAPRPVGGRPEPIAAHLVRALNSLPHRQLHDWQQQTLLIFLPGWRAIESCRRQLLANWPELNVYCLHSRVERREQALALDPSQGARVILATNIAETSLTIADVTLVIDSGLVREADFEQQSGVTQLQTRRISSASAEQRRGRAGRVQAGHCMRLWSDTERLAPQAQPAIRRTDYVPLALRLAHWGTPPAQLPWLTPPNPLALRHAYRRLRRWQFVDTHDAITSLGRKVARLGTHPRIAALLLHAGEELDAHGWLLLLALALHFDLPFDDNPDADGDGHLSGWLRLAEVAYQQHKHWRQLAARWQRVLAVKVSLSSYPSSLPAALVDRLTEVLADRLGHLGKSGRYRLNCGISVSLDNTEEWALVLQLHRRGRQYVGVGLAVAPSEARIQALAERRSWLEVVGSGRRRRWVEHSGYYLGGQQIDVKRRDVEAAAIPAAIVGLVQQQGLADTDWPTAALDLLLRARWAAKLELLAGLPALDDTTLEQQLPALLEGFLNAQSELDRLPLEDALVLYLGYDVKQQLQSLLPERMNLPSGRRVRIDYQGGVDGRSLVTGDTLPTPSIAAKLQEFFGVDKLAIGRLPLSIQLLSPAGSPLAITQDLAYFWRDVYPQVRREMRGRYIKHPWPEDPLAHAATALTKRRLES